MEFEWDESKSARNLAERGFGFDFAALIFDGLVLEFEDDRHDYGERRIQAIGQIGTLTISVVYTNRELVRRIISARLANKRERRLWLSFAGA